MIKREFIFADLEMHNKRREIVEITTYQENHMFWYQVLLKPVFTLESSPERSEPATQANIPR